MDKTVLGDLLSLSAGALIYEALRIFCLRQNKSTSDIALLRQVVVFL